VSHPMGDGYALNFSRTYREWFSLGGRGQDPLELQDAAYECEHGNLPLDKVTRCACFQRWGA
jgi:hypothetical protein